MDGNIAGHLYIVKSVHDISE